MSRIAQNGAVLVEMIRAVGNLRTLTGRGFGVVEGTQRDELAVTYTFPPCGQEAGAKTFAARETGVMSSCRIKGALQRGRVAAPRRWN